ncbi:MAG: APC family permease, partial [Myxococcota bacterium]|nr:APC family permease [Myxococcota bacterium]
GYLPRILARRHPRSGAPWVSITVCCEVYASCLGLGLRRLIELDVLLYGSSLVLEFAALVLLRVREPTLPRLFVIPGGLVGAVAIGVPPTALLAIAVVKGAREQGGGRALLLAAALLATGPIIYTVGRSRGRRLR